uniref:Uncharacterized protein n=1 Tax=Populus trichocarpa TaxID=3694 RepID=A9PHF0_POPTR|nr:unknown [Populus trichocarpa]
MSIVRRLQALQYLTSTQFKNHGLWWTIQLQKRHQVCQRRY